MFTDEDLKRFKEDMENTLELESKAYFEALLARLEAAESALIELYSLTGPFTSKGKAWRKAAGKGSDK